MVSGPLYVQVVFQSRGFHELSEETMIFVLKCNGLQLDEGEVLKHVKEWASVNSVRFTGCSAMSFGGMVAACHNVNVCMLGLIEYGGLLLSYD